VISCQPKHVRDIVSILYTLDPELEMDMRFVGRSRSEAVRPTQARNKT
jgi:hypothetical protein